MNVNIQDKEYCKYITEQYNNNKSTYEIAEELQTYANRIKRDLVKLGVALRDRKESQKAALSSGRKPHPTQGKQRSNEVKLKISKKMCEFWENMDEETLNKRSAFAKARWEAMSLEERQNMQTLAAQGLREAAKHGSALEKELLIVLTNRGYSVEQHKCDLLPNEKLHIDLYISSAATAIEIDGPTHFLPIWGEERLKKTMVSDAKKTGLLISRGIKIIRVKLLQKTVSQTRQQELADEIIRLLSLKVRKKFIEIEVNNG